jgi:acyl-coenzyme A synthetase/AMP-(fatty) acid ligase/aryl carrier-like protein
MQTPYIGKPIANTQIYILDRYYKIQPVGVYGEIFISGESVGKGYINNPSLTSEKFFALDLFGKPVKVYQTGDIAKWTSDGNIDFLGRADNQVKVRGYRIELEEIQNYFLKNTEIKECTVLLHDFSNDRKELVAFFTSTTNIDLVTLRKYLKGYLPAYMIPKYLIQVSDMPLNRNGKVNKDVLSTYSLNRAKKEASEKPVNRNEEILVDIWKDVLDNDEIGTNDDFFDIGGDSLLAIKVALDAAKKGLNFTILDLYKNPTIKELCKQLDSSCEVI